ncbi:hypothetical protein HHI36_021204 [Cryptolaemus montrouzieri]|uniref:Uncharacterized protein n=1 Tax=Cryptolaemus montrouzieri TaxID=559131 RepID=A0ABD2MWD4_9CUCU
MWSLIGQGKLLLITLMFIGFVKAEDELQQLNEFGEGKREIQVEDIDTVTENSKKFPFDNIQGIWGIFGQKNENYSTLGETQSSTASNFPIFSGQDDC